MIYKVELNKQNDIDKNSGIENKNNQLFNNNILGCLVTNKFFSNFTTFLPKVYIGKSWKFVLTKLAQKGNIPYERAIFEHLSADIS